MANIGYRTFDGSSEHLTTNLGNIASANSVPETWAFAGRLITYATADGELVAAPGWDPTDWYISHSGSKYQFYNGVDNATDGPGPLTGNDVIVVFRRDTSTAARWSIATHNGSVWSSFTHTNSSVTFGNRTYPSSGVMDFSPALGARFALVARCSTAISDGDVATLTTDLAAWSALSTCTNLWRFDQTPVVDLEGTATSNTLTGSSVTATAFPLDEGSATVTGTVAVTLDAFTSTASGTFTPAGTDPPTLLAPADDATADLDDGETFSWTHNGAGAQAEFAFRRRGLPGGDWEYWTGTAWQPGEIFITSATESVTIGAGDW